MSRNPNLRTNCSECAYQGPQVHVKRRAYRTCLRHRLDGEPHALPQEWVDLLIAGDVACDLFKPAAKEAA